MAWIKIKTNTLILVSVIFTYTFTFSSGLDCGYPGSPAYGRPVPVRESYNPGSAVSYSCAYGYTLKGSHQRTCLDNGTWSGIIPICDRSLSGIHHHASTRAVYGRPQQEQQYLSIQNVIDGNKDTCTYTDPQRPRWIRIDLHENHLIEAVALTVPKNMYASNPAHLRIYVISVTNLTTHPYSGSATYHKCAEFNGKFSTTTVKLSCATGGYYGRYVHIEDQRNSIAYFALCEVDIFVQKDSYECGEPDRPSNSYTSNPEAGVVEYRCVHGYQLEGHVRRHCLLNGQWSGTQPLCLEIVCPILPPIQNGIIQYGGPIKGKLVQGTIANASCDYGYKSNTLALQCLDTGQWSEGKLECEAVNCQTPAIRNDMEKYILLNGSTLYGSMVLFYCGDVQPEDGDPLTSIRICREDGTWSDTTIECKTPDDNSVETLELGLVEDDKTVIPNSVIISMAVVVFALLLVLLLILLFRRKQLSRRQSVESLPSKDTSSSLTMSEVKSGVPYENDAFYATISADDSNQGKPNESETEASTNKKDQRIVERGILSTILFAKRRANNNDKNKSKSGAYNSSNCFYEEVGVQRSCSKKPDESAKSDGDDTQPVYAQVDLNQKRKSRLAKTTLVYADIKFPNKSGNKKSSDDEIYRKEEMPSYDSELDSEVVLRELPPIPDDDDQSSGTYASLSKPSEPPGFMRENAIYGSPETSYEKQNHPHHFMKDNDVYST